MATKQKPKLKAVPSGPQILKSPIRLEMMVVPDDTGLRLKEIVGMFVFAYPDDPFSGGAEKSPILLEAKDRAFLEELYDASLAKFIEKHKTQGRAYGIAHNAKIARQQDPPR